MLRGFVAGPSAQAWKKFPDPPLLNNCGSVNAMLCVDPVFQLNVTGVVCDAPPSTVNASPAGLLAIVMLTAATTVQDGNLNDPMRVCQLAFVPLAWLL